MSIFLQNNACAISNATKVLCAGGVILYPTETVYGLGADALNPDAVNTVRRIKGRDAHKPILALVADTAMLEEYAHLTPLARALAERFLPGPLSLVLTARDDRLASIGAPDGAVGFRIPNHSFCLNLAKNFGRPITSTSANKSGMAQPCTLADMLDQLGEGALQIGVTIDGGEVPAQTHSTIVDARGTVPRIVREGAISRDLVLAACGD